MNARVIVEGGILVAIAALVASGFLRPIHLLWAVPAWIFLRYLVRRRAMGRGLREVPDARGGSNDSRKIDDACTATRLRELEALRARRLIDDAEYFRRRDALVEKPPPSPPGSRSLES